MWVRYIVLVFMLFAGIQAHAGKHRYRGEPRTEEGLMNNVLGCLSNKDSLSYFYLFPPFDSLWALVIYNRDPSPDVVRDLNSLKAHPQSLLQFDPYYNHSIITRFENVVKKGEDSGIHWNNVVMQRYELTKQENTTQAMVGYDRIVPERFKGYMFVRDLLGRATYCITIAEIQQIKGYYFGGQVLNILEASTIDEYVKKEEEEKKYFDWLAKNLNGTDTGRTDSVKERPDTTTARPGTKNPDFLSINTADEDSVVKTRKEVVDRKYYEGKFDDEIPVKLFVRYMKDFKTGTISAYDGLYKFGDQKKYIKLTIQRDKNGKWVMEDDAPTGTMELELKNKVYTGSWTNNDNQTGYDVVLTQTAAPEIIIEQLDRMLETGNVGRVNEETKEEKPPKPVVITGEEVEGVNSPEATPSPADNGEAKEKPKKEKTRKEKRKRKYDDDDQ